MSDASRLNLISVAWDIRCDVRKAYLQLYAALEEHDLLLDEQAVLEEKQVLFGHLANIGEITQQELTGILASCYEISLAVAENSKRVQDARLECANAIGVPVAAFDNVRFSFREFDGIQTRIINAYESAVSGYMALQKNVLTADSLLMNISSLVEQQQASHRIGEMSSLDLIDGRLRLIAAERVRLSVYVRAYKVIGDIEDTTQLPCIGGGWDWDILQSRITGDAK